MRGVHQNNLHVLEFGHQTFTQKMKVLSIPVSPKKDRAHCIAIIELRSCLVAQPLVSSKYPAESDIRDTCP